MSIPGQFPSAVDPFHSPVLQFLLKHIEIINLFKKISKILRNLCWLQQFLEKNDASLESHFFRFLYRKKNIYRAAQSISIQSDEFPIDREEGDDSRNFPTSLPWRACGGGAVPLPLGERFPWEKKGWETEAGAGGGGEGERRPRILLVYLHEKEAFLEGLSLLTGGEVRDQDAMVEGVDPDGYLHLHVRAEVETVRGGEEGRAMLDVAGGGAEEMIRACFEAGRWHEDGEVIAYKEGTGGGSEMGGGRNCPPFNGRREKRGGILSLFLEYFPFPDDEPFDCGPRLRNITGRYGGEFGSGGLLTSYCNVYSSVSGARVLPPFPCDGLKKRVFAQMALSLTGRRFSERKKVIFLLPAVVFFREQNCPCRLFSILQ